MHPPRQRTSALPDGCAEKEFLVLEREQLEQVTDWLREHGWAVHQVRAVEQGLLVRARYQD